MVGLYHMRARITIVLGGVVIMVLSSIKKDGKLFTSIEGSSLIIGVALHMFPYTVLR